MNVLKTSLRLAVNAIKRWSQESGAVQPNSLQPPVLNQLIEQDSRYNMFKAAIEFINYEMVEGDILEFGVFTGMSLALLQAIQLRSFYHGDNPRRVAGFDSFEGLVENPDQHPRWAQSACKYNHGWHPLLKMGDRVTAQACLDLFTACKLPAPEIEVGHYAESLPKVLGTKYKKVARSEE